MNENHVDLNQINYLLGQINYLLDQEGLSAEDKAQLESLKARCEALVNQANTIKEGIANVINDFNKTEEEIELKKEHARLSDLISHYTEINKTSLTDYEANFRRAMMKEDGSGLIQRLFACIEKDPRYATSPEYLADKKEIEEAFKNPFEMKKFAKKQEEYIATREKYRELIAKDSYNIEEIKQITTKLKKLQESIVTEANKYLFNKEKLETLFEKNIKNIARSGSNATYDERNAIKNEIQKVYQPFYDRFDSESLLESYTKDLAKIEAQMAELEVKKSESKEGFAATATPASSAEPETISKTATQGTPVTPASSVGTATNPTGTNPEKDSETKDHSGLHFIGLPNDKYYVSVRDAYRYGDEIEIDKEEEIDGTTFITLKGSDVKIKKSLFATTADIEDEFKDAMKAHKTSTNHIKAGMKVTPCWPGHYNRAILKNGSRGNTADIEVKNMKLHDEIEVEKVFYRGTRKFVKLVGYENAFSADSFAIAPSTIKEIAEKKAAAKKDKEELKAKKPKTGPENETKDPKLEELLSKEEFDNFTEKYDDAAAAKDEKLKTPENEQQTPESEPVVEEPIQSVSDSLDKADNIDPKNKKEYQATFDKQNEQNHGKKEVTATKPTPDKQTKLKAILGAFAGIAKNKRTPLRVRIASLGSLITSGFGKSIEGSADIAQEIVEETQNQEVSEDVKKLAKEMQAEAARQEEKVPEEKENKWII